MAAPNLDFARERAESLMVDSVVITHEPHGKRDATMDPETGELVGPGFGPTDVSVYTGKARIHPPQSEIPRSDAEGGVVYGEAFYPISIPWNAPAPAIGNDVVVSASERDPSLAGKRLVIRAVSFHSFLVVRRFIAELRS